MPALSPVATPATLITGASSGIGESLARQLAAQEKQALILVARRADKLTALAQELQQTHGVPVTVIAQDLQAPAAAAQLLQEVARRGYTVDTLINNAGVGINDDFCITPLAQVQGMLQLNLVALTELCHGVLPAMRAQQRGRILNIASTAAFQACPSFAVYGASKAYVLSFSEALAAEERRHGLLITVACPGSTRTPFHDTAGSHGSLLTRLMDEADAVAASALAALNAGKTLVVTGWMNKPLPFLQRFLPRAVATRIAEQVVRRKK